MKKIRTFLISIILLITVFSFNNNVYAAPTDGSGGSSSKAAKLTCVYKHGSIQRKRVIVQYGDGTIEAYYNLKDKKISEDGWKKYSKSAIKNGIEDKYKDEYLTANGYLKKCPAAVNATSISGDGIIYLGTAKGNLGDLREALNTKETVTGKSIVPGTEKAKKAVEDQDKKEEKEKEKKEKEKEEKEKKIEETKGKKCSEYTVDDYNNAWLANKSTLSCLYSGDINDQCVIIQLNLKQGEKPVIHHNLNLISEDVFITNELDIDRIIKDYSGQCPIPNIFANKQPINGASGTEYKISLVKGTGNNAHEMIFRYASGKNLKNGNDITGSEIKIDFAFDRITIDSCEDLFSGTSGQKLKDVLISIRLIVQVSVPLLLIGLGIIDFSKAIISESEDNMKKIQNKFIRRVIIGIAFFLIPALLRIILTIASGIWPVISADLCGII